MYISTDFKNLATSGALVGDEFKKKCIKKRLTNVFRWVL